MMNDKCDVCGEDLESIGSGIRNGESVIVWRCVGCGKIYYEEM